MCLGNSSCGFVISADSEPPQWNDYHRLNASKMDGKNIDFVNYMQASRDPVMLSSLSAIARAVLCSSAVTVAASLTSHTLLLLQVLLRRDSGLGRVAVERVHQHAARSGLPTVHDQHRHPLLCATLAPDAARRAVLTWLCACACRHALWRGVGGPLP